MTDEPTISKDEMFHIKTDKSEKIQGKTRGERKRIRRMKRFLEIFRANTCKVFISCEKANIHHSTYYEWMEKYPWFADEVESAEEKLKDYGENYLLQKMKEGDTRAIIFFNETKNKDRGYTKKQITELQGEVKQTFEPIRINVIRPDVQKKEGEKGQSKEAEKEETSDGPTD